MRERYLVHLEIVKYKPHPRTRNLHIFHSRFAHVRTQMEEHHQLRGDDESHRNNHTQSRCTPRDSALPPLDWHVYFPNVEYDVTSDRRCELASKLIDAFCLATNGAELFDQVIIIYCVFSRRDETKRDLSLSLSLSLALGVFSRDVNDDLELFPSL